MLPLPADFAWNELPDLGLWNVLCLIFTVFGGVSIVTYLVPTFIAIMMPEVAPSSHHHTSSSPWAHATFPVPRR